jgi:hypothetical protein
MVTPYQEQVRSRGANQQDLQVRADPSAFGADIGRGLGQLAKGVADVGDMMKFKEGLKSENDARDAVNAYTKRTQDIRYDPDTGYLNQTGANAAEGFAAYEDNLASSRDEIGAKLDPAARRAYYKQTDELALGARSQGVQHDAKQLRDTTNATGEASVKTALDEALLNYQDPVIFSDQLGRAVSELDRLGRLNGTPTEARRVAATELVSGAHLGVIARIADSGVGGATRANAYYKEHSGQFTAADTLKIDTVLKPLIIKDKARLDANAMIDSSGTAPQGYANTPSAAAGSAPTARETSVDDLMVGPRKAGNVSYANGGAIRNQKATPGLEARIGLSVETVFGAGSRVVIYSGGQKSNQPGEGTGSTRHNGGQASDVYVYGPDGKQIKGDALGALAQFWLAKGYGGVGLEMHGGGIHLDEHTDRASTWNYAAEGGEFTTAQQAAVQAGLRGELPGGAVDRMLTEHLGRTFGPTFATAIQNAPPGASITSIIGAEEAQAMGLTGMTVGMYVRKAQITLGSPAAPQPSGVKSIDWATAYNQAAELMARDPEGGAALYEELNNRKAAYDAATGAQQKVDFDTSWQRGVSTGQWELSVDERMAMGAAGSAAFDNAAQAFQQGIQYTDPIVFTELADKAAKDPKAFAEVNLSDYLTSNMLTDADYRTLYGLQSDISTAASPLAQQQALAKAMGGVDPGKLWSDTKETYGQMMGYNPTPSDPADLDAETAAQVARFKMALSQQAAEFVNANKREWTPLEQQQIVYNMLEPVAVGQDGTVYGTNTKTVPRFDANNQVKPGGQVATVPVTLDQMPEDVRQVLVPLLPPGVEGPAAIAATERVFNNLLAVAAGGKPEVTIDDVPDSIIVQRPIPGSWGNTLTFGLAGDEGTDGYVVQDDYGRRRTLTEEQLTGLWANVERARLLSVMRNANLTPQRMLSLRPVVPMTR